MEIVFDDERYLIIKTDGYLVCFSKTDKGMVENFVAKDNSGEVKFINHILSR